MSSEESGMIFPGLTRLVYDKIDYGLLLLAGAPGVGKTILCKESVYKSLKEGNSIVYLTTEETPEAIVSSMKKFGWDVTDYVNNDKLRIVDAFSGRGNMPANSKFRIEDPENLTNVSIMIEKAREGVSDVVFVLDSITRLILGAGTEWGRKFMQTVACRLQGARALGICVLDVGILDETFLNFLRFLFDGVIDMRVTDEGGQLRRLIRVYSLKMGRHDTSWHEFQITPKGIEIL